jgi:DNA-binding CsgD family transcriptional regulator
VDNWDPQTAKDASATTAMKRPPHQDCFHDARATQEIRTVHAPSDFELFRKSVADAVEHGDATTVLAAIHPTVRTIAVEHGSAFRELVGGLPAEIWHTDPRIAAAMGSSFRATGSPRGQASLGYFRAAEDAIATTDHVPPHCLVSVLIGHAAALRTHGLLAEARAKLADAQTIMETEVSTRLPMRIECGARWNLELGMVDLHEGLLDSARSHLEYAHGHAAEHLTRAELIECLGAIAILDGCDGEFDRALLLIGEARQVAEGTELLMTGYGAPALSAEVMIANERSDLRHSSELEADMLAAATYNEWEPFARIISAQLRGLEGHPIVALDALSKANQGYAGWDTHGIGVDFARLLQGAMLMLVEHGDEAWNILQTLRPYEHHPLCPARMVGQLRLRHGDLVGADEAIRDCEALGDAHCERTLVDIQLLRSAIEYERGNFVVSDVRADRAFITMARTGARIPLRRIPAAVLSGIAARAVERRHSPAIAAMLTEIVEQTAGSKREVESLSARERLVLAQVQRGFTVAAIAAELYISPNTVKTHLRRLYRKLGVSTREEAIRAARALGLEQEITRDSPGSHRDSSEDAVL